MNRRGMWRPLLVGAIASVLGPFQAGCALFNLFDDEDILLREEVDAGDRDGIFLGVRLTVNLLGDEGPVREGLFDRDTAPPTGSKSNTEERDPTIGASWKIQSSPPEPRSIQTTLSADVEYAVGLGGTDAQVLFFPSDYINYGGTLFTTQGSVQSSYDIHLGTGGFRVGMRFRERFTLEALLGLSMSALYLQIRSPTERATDTSVSMGAHVGARATVTPHPVFDIYGDLKIHLLGGLQDSRQLLVLRTGEFGANLHLTRNASIFGGWRWWNYAEDVQDASNLEDIDLSGPTFGVLGRF